MLKSNHFRKVEELIELRRRMSTVTGTIDLIRESIRLWEKCDKLDEYSDNFWCNHHEAVELCIANLYADLSLVWLVAQNLGSWYMLNRAIGEGTLGQRREGLMREMLWSSRPLKHKLMKLRRTAKSATVWINHVIEGQWEQWIRKDSYAPTSLVNELSRLLAIWDAEIREYWGSIVAMLTQEENAQLEAVVN
jgi:hypothetical protein